MTQTVIGIFDSPDAVYAAVDALIDQEVDESSIYLSATAGSAAAAGLKGQSMGAIRDYLNELFGPDDSQDADYYAEEIKQGGILLSVDVADERDVEPVCEAIEEAGALDTEALQSGEEGESGSASESTRKVVPVVEEQMEIGKRQVAKGKVRVVSRIVETPVREKIRLQEEYASIKRRPVNKPVTPDEIDALEGATIEVEETAERPVVQKSARIVEEVEVGRKTREKIETVEDTERHTEVEVERETPQEPRRKGRK